MIYFNLNYQIIEILKKWMDHHERIACIIMIGTKKEIFRLNQNTYRAKYKITVDHIKFGRLKYTGKSHDLVMRSLSIQYT